MRVFLLLSLCLTPSLSVLAQSPPVESESAVSDLLHFVQRQTTRTLGGRQFWTDVCYWHGWRIQLNAFSGHYRLLDPENHRSAAGELSECQAALDEIRSQQSLPPMSGRAVILIHGLIRSSRSFDRMVDRLQSEDCTVIPFEYASTRASIPESAACLQQLIDSLEGIDRIDLVVHSMGGLVLRACLLENCDSRIERAVMLGVPNHGARLADRLHGNALFRTIYGPAGQQLISDDDGFIADLPVPSFEFGIIAGGRGSSRGFNPLLSGDNDSTVTVRSARLQGAADFLVLPVIHSLLMVDQRCIDAVESFLTHGSFDPERQAEPIPADPGR